MRDSYTFYKCLQSVYYCLLKGTQAVRHFEHSDVIELPYSRKILRKNIFCKFLGFVAICEVFFMKVGGVPSFDSTSEQSAKILFFHYFMKVSRYTVSDGINL